MLCHGPVRVANDARPGKAIVRVEFPPSAKFRSFPTEFDVVIE